jgi:hypothetical protein
MEAGVKETEENKILLCSQFPLNSIALTILSLFVFALFVYSTRLTRTHSPDFIPTSGNLFLPVRLLVWADGRGTVAQADSAARAELQEAPKQKLLQLKNIQKYYWVKHREMHICCVGVSPDM